MFDLTLYKSLLVFQFMGGSKPDKPKKLASPRGIYLYGSVGCGKTMLMDFFHDTCDVEQKQRVHFHAFMLDVHKRKSM